MYKKLMQAINYLNRFRLANHFRLIVSRVSLDTTLRLQANPTNLNDYVIAVRKKNDKAAELL